MLELLRDSTWIVACGDAARIAAVTSLIENTYNVDPHRVYVNGLSAGGGMASVMAATYPDYFAAIGIGSGCEYAATAAVRAIRAPIPPRPPRPPTARWACGATDAVHRFPGPQRHNVRPINADQRSAWLLTNDLADEVRPTVGGERPRRPLPATGRRAAPRSAPTAKRRRPKLGTTGSSTAWPCLVGRERVAALSLTRQDPTRPAACTVLLRHPDSVTDASGPPAVDQPTPTAAAAPPPAGPTRGQAALPKSRRRRQSGAMSACPPCPSCGSPTAGSPSRSPARDRRRCGSSDALTDAVRRAHKRRACTRYSTKVGSRAPWPTPVASPSPCPSSVHGHRLPRGRYRAMVTPADAAGASATREPWPS